MRDVYVCFGWQAVTEAVLLIRPSRVLDRPQDIFRDLSKVILFMIYNIIVEISSH